MTLVAGWAPSVARERRCEFCRDWFLPDRRVGPRQRACKAAKCRTARHAAACRSWREANPTDPEREARRLKEFRAAHADELREAREDDGRWRRELEGQRARRERLRETCEVVRDAINSQGSAIKAVEPGMPVPRPGEVVRDESRVESLVLLALAASLPVPSGEDVVRDEMDRRIVAWQDLGRSIARRA